MRVFSSCLITILVLFFSSLKAKNVDVGFQYFNFQNNEGVNYIETYLSLLSTELIYKKVTNDEFQGSVLINLEIKKQDTIYYIDKYLFKTPLVKDTLKSQFFIDKQIIPLENGSYELNFSISDIHSNNVGLNFSNSILVNLSKKKICFSDIIILDKYYVNTDNGPLNKSGYDIIPLHKNGDYFIDKPLSNLNFYLEWYNTELDSATNLGYLLNYFIENEQTHIPISGFNAVKRKTPKHQTAHIGGFDISLLPSGNYNLVVQILNKEGVSVIKKRLFFQRKNTKTIIKPQDYSSFKYSGSFVDEFNNIEEMAENISCLFPIANLNEQLFAKNQLAAWDIEQMKKFFYGFWASRNPSEPELEWNKYFVGVKKVNELFSSNKIKGFATDRGKTFLKYGTADDIENSVRESNMLPYQIWTYYKINQQTNRVFIFVETAVGTNEYELIHSNAQGELYNQNWRNVVFKNKF